ncbi:MAG: PmoA family protein [Propionibacteriaceae bacterium]|nr:PmoA family protein [Propionibacteriaceae bacterium]
MCASHPATAVLVGVGGFGRIHLANLYRLSQAGQAEVVGLVSGGGVGRLDELVDAPVAAWARTLPVYPTLDTCLAARPAPDVTVIATPIPTHLPLALTALAAGSHVALEKPPVPGLADFERLLAAAAAAGREVQVGFQACGSLAWPRLAELMASGAIGELDHVAGLGTWSRSTAYWTRSRWAGRRWLDGQPVVDGVVTNPLAHAVAAGLKLAGAVRAEDVATVTTDLYRANDIAADDTSAVAVTTAAGRRVTFGLTLAAAEQTEPLVIAYGTAGRLVFSYTQDWVDVTVGGQTRRERFGRVNLVENLFDHLADPAVALLSPLADTGAFTRVLDAVAGAPDARRIPKQFIDWLDRDGERWAAVRDVTRWCDEVAETGRTFAELGAPWAAPRHGAIAEVVVAGPAGPVAVGRYVDGAGAATTDSPRPHFHPLTTLAGTLVTDDAPADHSWQAGLGWAVQDVARDGEPGHNLWGGRTYVRGRGYEWLGDHGQIVSTGWTPTADGGVDRLDWLDRDGVPLLRETRTLRWRALDARTWALRVTTVLRPADGPVSLGSPGSNGRERAGYGGFFWRLPEGIDVAIRTPDAEGEAAVHGTVAPWVAWSATVPASGNPAAPPPARYTVALSADDPATQADPWFVRLADYPAIGSSIAWNTRTPVPPAGLTRSFTCLLADGPLDPPAIEAALTTARA